MNGLVSCTPSQSAVRLALGGFLLLIVQSVLLLLASTGAADLRGLVWVLTLLAAGALIAALVGPPEPPSPYRRERHER